MSDGLRFAYNTNGFAHHRLEDIFDVLSRLGYDAASHGRGDAEDTTARPDRSHLAPILPGRG